uniref:HNH endonuclease n=1 Tax=Actinopolymorpha alba TaxID=533267 RepID=UPI000476D2A0
ADIAISLLSGEADVIICNGEEEAREGAASREQTNADAESADAGSAGEDCDCDCENGDRENSDDSSPRQESFDDLLEEQNNTNSPSEAEGAQEDSAAEQDGCRHTGCDHDQHLAGCPCEDCKPATYTHPLDRLRPQPRDDDGSREEIPSDDDLAEREIPAAFRSWKAAVKAKLQLNVPITTLFELAERPAELGGFGPVLTEVARRLIANHLDNPDAMFTIGITHPVTGQLLNLHPISKRFLRGLPAEFVQSLNQRCTWMLCRRPAISCDLDHTKPYSEGGETSVNNVAPLCRRHHRVKTEGDWKVEQTSPGHLTYTDPHGRQYTVTPPRLTDPVEPDDPDPPPF